MEPSATQVTMAAQRYQAVLARGVVGVIFGVAVIEALPVLTLRLLTLLWAAYVVSDGLLAIVVAQGRGRTAQRWGWLLFEGVLGLGAGILTLSVTGTTTLGLLMTIGVRTLLSGISELREASLVRAVIPDELTIGASGSISVVAGVLMMAAYNDASVQLVVWLIGGHAFVFGVLEIILGAELFRWNAKPHAQV